MTAIIVLEPASSGAALVAAAARLGLAAHVFSADRDERIVPPELRAAADSFTAVDTSYRWASEDEIGAAIDATLREFCYMLVDLTAPSRAGWPRGQGAAQPQSASAAA
ncbi:hypothetical protein [Burkholderia gladioli]|uniref:hypothetical protein n=1 Tax=Burkholderia gladioli TaxID=28095 RepID=UPI0022D34899|nr:hypothetical protein [Burkholderia gladioli]MDA0574925.1 hypothetical protein [Burkholderia gladioli]MDA0602855.1 hypothetical protein [Burkholderia gladioli]